jgi:hypothetical protein
VHAAQCRALRVEGFIFHALLNFSPDVAPGNIRFMIEAVEYYR